MLHPAVFHVPLAHILILVGGSILGSGMLFCYLKAMWLADPSIVISIFQLIPVFYVILGFFVFHDVLTISQLIGSFLIIAAALILSLSQLRLFLWVPF